MNSKFCFAAQNDNCASHKKLPNFENLDFWPILFWKKKRRNPLSSTFFLFKLTIRKLKRKWTLKNKLLFKFLRKKRPKPRKNNSKSRAFLNNHCNFFPKKNSQRKTGINLENLQIFAFFPKTGINLGGINLEHDCSKVKLSLS
jgi:hypothetical protein